jgi:hypothetical protein
MVIWAQERQSLLTPDWRSWAPFINMHLGVRAMHTDEKGLTRRLADRVYCVRQGHAWETTESTLGEVSLLRSDCARCGQIGRVHSAQQRDVETTSRAVVA